MLLNELFTRPDPETAMLDAALAALHRRISSKGDLQNIEGYAFDIARSFKTGKTPRELARLYRERYTTNEGYKLQLERDNEMLVLNITDTVTGKRTEVRGKPGYETGGYDPEDSLHILLDKIGKASNISDLMNGETVSINPKHPDARRAKDATIKAYNENMSENKVKYLASNFDHEWEEADTQINEAMDNPYPINWVRLGPHKDSSANVNLPDGTLLDIIFDLYDSGAFDIFFKRSGRLTATGGSDEFRIFATVIDAIRQWWKQLNKERVHQITFSAAKGNNSEDSKRRSILYKRFAKQFAQQIGWHLDTDENNRQVEFILKNPNTYNHDDEFEENFADGKINEVLDQPYSYSWVDKSEDEWQAQATLNSGRNLEIIIDTQSNQDEWNIDFFVDDDARATGLGDQFRIFATVVAAIKDWWKWASKTQNIKAIEFSASKYGAGDKGTDSRVKLYKKFAQQFASSIGFQFKISDTTTATYFIIENPNYRVEENFADGKKPGRKGLAKRSGVNTKASVSSLRKTAKNSSGEKQRMAHWLANMKSGRKKK